MKTIKVKLASWAKNGGDGSVCVYLYATMKEANKTASGVNERLDEDIQSHEIEIDIATGKIVSGLD